MIPNIKENPRNRKAPRRGRKRLFNQAIHALRERIERTFAWEDKFKRLLLRFEHIQQRHYGMKIMAYISITHAPSGHPGGILDRLRLMKESGLTLCPFLEGAFCPLSLVKRHGVGATYAYSGLEGLGFGGGVAAGAGQTQK